MDRVFVQIQEMVKVLLLVYQLVNQIVLFQRGIVMDPEKIINGMGVALSTTGVGIVISLVIDFFSSVVVSAHVGLVELGLGKAEELRMALLAERKGATGAVTSRARLSSSRESPAEFSGPQ